MDNNFIFELNNNNDLFFKDLFENDKIFNAFLFAKKAHYGQKRKSGDAYIVHPVAVALKLNELYDDEILTISALLHDTVEDCENVIIDEIYEKFGTEVGFIVDSLNKRVFNFYEYPKFEFINKISRFLWAGMQHVRVFLVKIADRENNLETLSELKSNKQVRMTFETQAIFQPLKNILRYESGLSLVETNLLFEKFVKYVKIDDSLQGIDKLKKILYEESFKDFNTSLFNVVYDNSSVVVWKVEGWDMYDKLCMQDGFKGKVEILKVESNGNNVSVDFKFKSGMIPSNKSAVKMKVSSFNQ